jgi:hypothetical protein
MRDGGRAGEARRRDDADREGLGRLPPPGPSDAATWLVRVVDGGSMPSAAPRRFLGRRQAFAGGGVSGAASYEDLPGDVVFTCLDGVPSVGDRLLIHRAGGRWDARLRGTPPGPPDWSLCVVVRGCDGPFLRGATVTARLAGDVVATCVTDDGAPPEAPATGRCCLAVPGPGTYQVTASHPDYGEVTFAAVSSWPNMTFAACVPGAAGMVCVPVGGCGGGFPDPGAMAVQFLQGGVVVAEVPVSPYADDPGSGGRACACLPARVATTIRVVNVPSRYATTERTVPAALIPPCGQTRTLPEGGITLDRAPGFDCWPCPILGPAASGCLYPVASVIHTTDPLTGRAVALARSGWQYLGTDTVPYPGCPYGCPPDEMDVEYSIAPATGDAFGRCQFVIRWMRSAKFVNGAWIWCPGNTPGEGAPWASAYALMAVARVTVTDCPPGFAAVSTPIGLGWCGPVTPTYTFLFTE